MLTIMPFAAGLLGGIAWLLGADPGISGRAAGLGLGLWFLFFGFGFTVNVAFAILVARRCVAPMNPLLWIYSIMIQCFYALLLAPSKLGHPFQFVAIALGVVG